MDKAIMFAIAFVAGIALVAVFSIFLAFPVMWCWNYTMPDVFGFSKVSWGQAWCLSFLSASFFRSTNINNND